MQILWNISMIVILGCKLEMLFDHQGGFMGKMYYFTIYHLEVLFGTKNPKQTNFNFFGGECFKLINDLHSVQNMFLS
jgi:hypothetical protein